MVEEAIKKLKIFWLLTSSAFAWSFGFIRKEKLYQRLDRAAEIKGLGPGFFSDYGKDNDGTAS